jgi:pyrrolysine biosynthesis protein PylC
VRVFETEGEAAEYIAAFPPEIREEYILQEYVEGQSYSIEVIGVPGNYRTYAITEIHVDAAYDCNLVTTPCDLPVDVTSEFRADAVRLAEALKLHAIMDVEAIFSGVEMKVLEIDARLPSQTPAAICASTGINMVSELVDLFGGGGKAWSLADDSGSGERVCAAYENILVNGGEAVSLGEHIMSEALPLTLHRDFKGADVAITDYVRSDSEYRGIYISSAKTPELLEAKRRLMYDKLICQ